MAYLNQAYRGGDSEQRPGWWISFDYDRDVIETLKSSVKPECRIWDAENKRWWIFEPYERVLLRLFTNFEAFLYQPRLL